jgi:hypothetical protein
LREIGQKNKKKPNHQKSGLFSLFNSALAIRNGILEKRRIGQESGNVSQLTPGNKISWQQGLHRMNRTSLMAGLIRNTLPPSMILISAGS